MDSLALGLGHPAFMRFLELQETRVAARATTMAAAVAGSTCGRCGCKIMAEAVQRQRWCTWVLLRQRSRRHFGAEAAAMLPGPSGRVRAVAMAAAAVGCRSLTAAAMAAAARAACNNGAAGAAAAPTTSAAAAKMAGGGSGAQRTHVPESCR